MVIHQMVQIFSFYMSVKNTVGLLCFYIIDKRQKKNIENNSVSSSEDVRIKIGKHIAKKSYICVLLLFYMIFVQILNVQFIQLHYIQIERQYRYSFLNCFIMVQKKIKTIYKCYVDLLKKLDCCVNVKKGSEVSQHFPVPRFFFAYHAKL